MEQESTPREPIPQDPTTTGQEPYNSMSAEDKKRLVREELVRREQQRKDKLVDVVMRQTDYDREKSQIKLKEHNFDVEKIHVCQHHFFSIFRRFGLRKRFQNRGFFAFFSKTSIL